MHKRGTWPLTKNRNCLSFGQSFHMLVMYGILPHNMWITTHVLEEFIKEHDFVITVPYLWRSSSLLTCIMEVNIGAKFTGWVQFTSCVNITCLDQIIYVFFAILVNGSILLLRDYMHLDVGTHKFKLCDVFMLRRNRCLYKDYIVFSIERNSKYLNVSLFRNWIFEGKKNHLKVLHTRTHRFIWILKTAVRKFVECILS